MAVDTETSHVRPAPTLEDAILSALASPGPHMAIDILGMVTIRTGLDPSNRELDRALQRLRKAGKIAYRKSTGQKNSHGWVRT